MILPAVERAFAKVNLCLLVGPTRADGRHELVTVFDTVGLADELHVSERPSPPDEVVCERVPGPNLVAAALAALREAGWDAPPLRVRIDKRIPVAAGMGGGSADAAAMLRCAPRLGAVHPAALASIAARLGADVPGRLVGGASLGTGAGEIVTRIDGLADYGVLVLAQPFSLSTAEVYREADRLGLVRDPDALAGAARRLAAALPALPQDLVVNDLQPAALSLRPETGGALDAVRGAGADHALVCGSGPTVIGLFVGPDGVSRAQNAATTGLGGAFPSAIGTGPVRSAQSGSRA